MKFPTETAQHLRPAAAAIIACILFLTVTAGTSLAQSAPQSPETPAAPQIETVAPTMGGGETPPGDAAATSDDSLTPPLAVGEAIESNLPEQPGELDAAGSEETIPPANEALEPVSPSGEVFDTVRAVLPETMHDSSYAAQGAADNAARFLRDGGPAIWAISLLSVVTLALILWKVWRLALIGAWSRGKAVKAVALYEQDEAANALGLVHGRKGLRSKVVSAAISARRSLPEDKAREETTRVAKHELAEAAVGLRALELIATIAPLLGLLGTVMGMIAAFQALQQSGSRADPSMLAGGIWEALLTTAAGMAVTIPASAALTWFEAVIDRMRRDIEDAAARIFVHSAATAVRDTPEALAAE